MVVLIVRDDSVNVVIIFDIAISSRAARAQPAFPHIFGLFYYFSKEVLYCCDRMIQYHTGSCIAHCLSYLLLHLWIVAVDRTLLARRFLFSELTMVQALIGIVKQSRTLFAKPFSCVLLPITVYLHHLPYCSLLLIYVCHTSLIYSK